MIHYFCHVDPFKIAKGRRLQKFYSKGLSFLRSVREKQQYFSPKPLSFRESLALERQKIQNFEKTD